MTEQRLKDLFDRYFNALMAYGYRFIENRQEVEEIVNDTFIRVWRGRIHDRGNTFSMMMTNVRHRCIDSIRQRMRHKAIEEKLETETTCEYDTQSKEDYDNLRLAYECIKRLPTARRDLMVLVYFYDYSVTDAAKVIGISPNTAWVQHKRGLDEIREYVKTRIKARRNEVGRDNFPGLIEAIRSGIKVGDAVKKFSISAPTFYKYKKMASLQIMSY
jgi:RNA polymerase sigma-70 factor (ECF subfamily)